MKSLRAEMVEEINTLTEEDLRKRLISAEHMIYILESRLQHTLDPLYGMDMWNLVEDEKEARAAYAAAREK